MKEIIYLDTNFLNSFLAQTNGGLPTTKSREESEEIKDALESSSGHKSASSIEATFKSGKFEIPLILNTPSGEVKGVWRPGTFSEEKAIASQTEAAKQIISTQMHDNSLEEFMSFLKKNESLTANDQELYGNQIGKYISRKSSFKIIDFEYLQRIMQADIFSQFMFQELEKQHQQWEEQIKVFPKTSAEYKKLNSQLKKSSDNLKNMRKKTNEQFKQVEDIMKYLTDILPNSTFIIGDGFIAPLKAEFLRELGKELTFKYGNSPSLKVTLLGKITGELNTEDLPNLDGVDAVLELHQFIYFMLNSLSLTKKGDLIVSPVAIYFE